MTLTCFPAAAGGSSFSNSRSPRVATRRTSLKIDEAIELIATCPRLRRLILEEVDWKSGTADDLAELKALCELVIDQTNGPGPELKRLRARRPDVKIIVRPFR